MFIIIDQLSSFNIATDYKIVQKKNTASEEAAF